MKTGTPVTVPLFNVNDESVVVSAWLAPEGTRVEVGQPLVSVETSKVSVEIEAPEAGYVRSVVPIGTEAPVGSILCYLAETAEASASVGLPGPPPPASWQPDLSPNDLSPNPPVSANGNDRAARLTPVARKMMEAHGLHETQFSGRARVRRQDVVELLERPPHLPPVGGETIPAAWSVTRFSTAAREMLTAQGLSEEQFAGRGLVRAGDIEAIIHPALPLKATNAEAAPSASSETPYRTEPLPRRKRMEIKYLHAGTAGALCSTVVVTCPTQGLRDAAGQADQIQHNATAIFIYEAARLLRQFPLFNAFYADGDAHIYEEVNIGFAIDAGFGLKVAVIRAADQKSIVEIAAEMQELVVAYLNDNLSLEALSSGTFTITDLSGEGVFTFNPLINQGQSAILGIGTEFFPPGSQTGMFNLILGFDHQLSEGRQAAKFLTALAGRMRSYEQALTPKPPSEAEEAPLCCARCFRTFDDLRQTSAFLVSTLDRDGSARPVCTLCLHGF